MIEIAELAHALMGLSDGSLDASFYDVATGILRSRTANKASIVNIAKQNICQLPVLVSNSICLDSYTKVCNSLEELYGTYLKMAIANSSEIIDLGKGQNKTEVIRRLHQNDNLNDITGFENVGEVMKK